MLIGIMRCAPREQTQSTPFEYQFQVLQRFDLLVQTGQKSTFNNVLETLKAFRKEWHRNEQFLLPNDVSLMNLLCSDVVVEIVKYLSFPNAINAFSTGILPLLRREHTKVHLDNPSHLLLEMILQHLDPRQIASLRFRYGFQQSDNTLLLSRIFRQPVSLTDAIVNQVQTQMINRLLCNLPNVRVVSLLLGKAIDWYHFQWLAQILSDHSATRLRIRSAGMTCGHLHDKKALEPYIPNTSITSCVFDLGRYLLRWHRPCHRQNPFCFLVSAMKFLHTTINLRRVKFMIGKSQTETFLQVLLWQQLISKCIHLDRVIIKVLDDGDYTQEAANIERELRQTRPGLIFQVKSA